MSLAATSLSDIWPFGETLDRVSPGISRVVARILGVADPETLELLRACLSTSGQLINSVFDRWLLTSEGLWAHLVQECLSKLFLVHLRAVV